MCTLYTYLPRYSSSGFFGPSKWIVLTPARAHIENPMCNVCVCVRIHTHTHMYIPTHVKNNKTKDNTSIYPFVQKKPPRQATSAVHRLLQPPHPRPQTRMNKLHTHKRTCAPCSDCIADMYGDVKNTCGTVHTCMHWCPEHLFSAPWHHAHCKHADTPAQACPCNSAATPSSCKRLRLILQLETRPRNSQNPHQPIAQAQLRCHTGIIWSSTLMRAPSSLSILRVTLALGRRGDDPHLNSISTIFAGFLVWYQLGIVFIKPESYFSLATTTNSSHLYNHVFVRVAHVSPRLQTPHCEFQQVTANFQLHRGFNATYFLNEAWQPL